MSVTAGASPLILHTSAIAGNSYSAHHMQASQESSDQDDANQNNPSEECESFEVAGGKEMVPVASVTAPIFVAVQQHNAAYIHPLHSIYSSRPERPPRRC